MTLSLKKLLKHPRVQAALCALVAGYIRLLRVTCHLHMQIDPASAEYVRGERQAIFAFWHGRLLMQAAFVPKSRPARVLISGHRDGVLISKTIAHFGIKTIEGSTSKNSLSALRAILKAAKEGDNIVITPDGPRGPIYSVAPGVAYIARASRLPVLPVSYAARPARRLKSWDRFLIPLPFARIEFMVGSPIAVDKDRDEGEACQHIGEALRALTQEVDERVQ